MLLAAIEICLTGLAIALAYIAPNAGADGFEKIQKPFLSLARRRWLAVLVVGLTALGARLAVLPVLPIPQPGIHDEFSHLLLADTIAHGRVANNTHPMWIHFETFHVNQQPTYASMYYPGQGSVLALGQVVFGHPFWGVWLSVGAMCAAICWMLQAWVPSGWALLGGLLAVMRLATFSYWANTYYGGAVAAIGGALVLGALLRIKRRAHVGDALLMGLGLAILANTRPYESLFFCTPVALVLFRWMFGRDARALQLSIRRVVIPLALVLCVTMLGMGYYFWRVSGSPFRLPYQVNMTTYHMLYFPWQELKPDVEFHHPMLREYYRGAPLAGTYHHARLHPLLWLSLKPLPQIIFFLGPALMLPLLAWIAIRRRRSLARGISRKAQFLLAVCGVTAIGLALPICIPPAHYAAPLTAAIYALVVQAMRYMRLWHYKGQPSGLFLVRAVPVICFALLPLRAVASSLHIPVPVTVIHTWYSEDIQNLDRARVLSQLQREPGEQLVIVRYKTGHEVLDEWVYNGADIDNSKVIWARDMGAAKNEELIRYFEHRRAWLLEPDEKPFRLSAYSFGSLPSGDTVAERKGQPKAGN